MARTNEKYDTPPTHEQLVHLRQRAWALAGRPTGKWTIQATGEILDGIHRLVVEVERLRNQLTVANMQLMRGSRPARALRAATRRYGVALPKEQQLETLDSYMDGDHDEEDGRE